MDWAQVAVNAVAAGTGAGIGSILGSLLGWLFSKKASILVQSLTVAGAVLGYSVLPPLIEPVIGPPIREVLGPPWELTELSEELRKEELLVVVFERRPELEGDFLRVIAEAYRAGGPDAVYNASYAWSAENIGALFEEYAPYARDEDLRAWLVRMSSFLDAMLDGDPFACHDFLFGTQTGFPLEEDGLPPELQAKLLQLTNDFMAPVIRYADLTVENVESDDARTVFMGFAENFVAELGEDRIQYVQSVRPETVEDARIVCRAAAGLYANIAEQPLAPQIARLMLSQ